MELNSANRRLNFIYAKKHNKVCCCCMHLYLLILRNLRRKFEITVDLYKTSGSFFDETIRSADRYMIIIFYFIQQLYVLSKIENTEYDLNVTFNIIWLTHTYHSTLKLNKTLFSYGISLL